MTYLLIAFVVLLALAPLTHFIPSKTQRLQAQLRETAALGGLFVEFRDLPAPAGGNSRVPRADSIYYGRRLRPSPGRSRRARRRWYRDEAGQWLALDGHRQPLPDALGTLPAGVLAVSVDEASCGVYWREAGDLSTVAQIQASLAAWAEELES